MAKRGLAHGAGSRRGGRRKPLAGGGTGEEFCRRRRHPRHLARSRPATWRSPSGWALSASRSRGAQGSPMAGGNGGMGSKPKVATVRKGCIYLSSRASGPGSPTSRLGGASGLWQQVLSTPIPGCGTRHRPVVPARSCACIPGLAAACEDFLASPCGRVAPPPAAAWAGGLARRHLPHSGPRRPSSPFEPIRRGDAAIAAAGGARCLRRFPACAQPGCNPAALPRSMGRRRSGTAAGGGARDAARVLSPAERPMRSPPPAGLVGMGATRARLPADTARS